MMEETLVSQSSDLDKLKAARACQRGIGRELRRRYDAVTHEEVPDDLMDLLGRIDGALHDGRKIKGTDVR